MLGKTNWSRWSGLNRRPTVYETVALPLSYTGDARCANEPVNYGDGEGAASGKLDGCRFFRERGPGKAPRMGSCRDFLGCPPLFPGGPSKGPLPQTVFRKLDTVLLGRGSRGGMELGPPLCSRNTWVEGTRAVRCKIGLAVFKVLVYCVDDFLTRG